MKESEKRRVYSEQFKKEAVLLVTEHGYIIVQAAQVVCYVLNRNTFTYLAFLETQLFSLILCELPLYNIFCNSRLHSHSSIWQL